MMKAKFYLEHQWIGGTIKEIKLNLIPMTFELTVGKSLR